MASIRDVAKKANVGPATVSRVLNNSGYVSEESRRRIEQAMMELDYTPNELARNLFRKKTGIVALLVPSISHPFFAAFVEKAEEALHSRGYKTMLCNTAKEENAELEYLDMLNRHIVDGIISGVHSLEIEEYQKIKKPIVALDLYLGADIPVVAMNHEKGGRMAAEELAGSGCRMVLHFRGDQAVESPYHDRHHAFDRIMKERQVEVYSYELERNRFDMEYFEAVIQDIFSREIKFDGVFGTDMLAALYLREAKGRGLRVPEDVRVVSYDGTYVSRMTRPGMTAIIQPVEKLANEAAKMIDLLINGEACHEDKVVMEVGFQQGETTFRDR